MNPASSMAEARGEGAERPKEMVLMIADISGYTKFMLANRQSIVHGQMIITELTRTILRQIELPLEVSKLEGDAVFLFAPKPAGPSEQETLMRVIGEKTESFFERFEDKLRELAASNICHCAACANAAELRLKLIVHCGTALRFTIGRFEELSGTDVILLHRLLKIPFPPANMCCSRKRPIEISGSICRERRRKRWNATTSPMFAYLFMRGPAKV